MEKVFSKTQRAESTCHLQIGLQQTNIEVSTKTSKKNSKSIRDKILFKGIWKGKSNQQKRKFLAKAKYSCKSIIFEKEFENEKATSKTQRAESTCHLLNGPSNVFDACAEKFFLPTHQRHWKVHRADDMCLSDRVCSDASSRWHVHKWFLGYGMSD